MKTAKVTCFGEVLWDVAPQGKTPGGAPMNVALHLQNLGMASSLISRVGQDELGQELLGYIEEKGLSPQYIQRDAQQPTCQVKVDLSDPTDAKYHFDTPTAWDYIELGTDNRKLVKSSDVLVFGSLASRRGKATQKSLHALLDIAEKSVFDVNFRPPFYTKEFVEKALEQTDVAKVNDEELGIICQWYGFEGNQGEQLFLLQERFGLEALCLTRGAEGAWLLERGNLYKQQGFAVKVQDTIGAGDSFLAAYISQWLMGAQPEDRLKYACAVGALVSSLKGANPQVQPSDISQLLQKG